MRSVALSSRQHRNEPVPLRQLRQLRERLTVEYADRVSATEIDAAVDAAVASFEGARVQQFVPIFVERAVRDALTGRAQVLSRADQCPVDGALRP